ncbi:DNA excision repair protein ERCC-6-like protein [Hordeum vulgare]|nr:DNA excision repair protein ERCC-6-like protein [Hordeum vulgare]
MGMRKVRLPGRRRLCKLGDLSSDDDDQPDVASCETEEPTEVFSDFRDDDDATDQEEENHRDTDTDEWEEAEEDDFQMEAPAGSGKPPYRLPARISKRLYDHQHQGLIWLWSLHCMETGGILGGDMGLGKTMQVSAFLAGLFHSGLIRRVLVIAPKTLLTHWIMELTVVGLRNMISDYSDSNLDARDFELQHAFKEGGILLTTYDIARINYRLIRGDFYNDVDEEEEGKIWN